MSSTYVHGHAPSVLNSHSTRTARNSCAYFLDRVTPGMRILDVGCGPGSITLDLAEQVGESGHVVGIDFSAEAVDSARQRARELGIDNVTFEVADLFDLPNTIFDIVHAHQVLQHLSNPVAALQKMSELCASDGLVVARDADYGGMFWYPESLGMSRWMEIYCASARQSGGQPNAGRHLLKWAKDANLEILSSTGSSWVYADEESRSWWSSSQANRVRHSVFAKRAADQGVSAAEIEDMAQSWEMWGQSEDGWFFMPHGEIIARARSSRAQRPVRASERPEQ